MKPRYTEILKAQEASKMAIRRWEVASASNRIRYSLDQEYGIVQTINQSSTQRHDQVAKVAPNSDQVKKVAMGASDSTAYYDQTHQNEVETLHHNAKEFAESSPSNFQDLEPQGDTHEFRLP